MPETDTAPVLPVPKYGRGPEILLLLKRFAPNLKFYGDAHFLRQLQQIQLGGPWLLPVPPHFADWVQPDAFLSREKGVVFLSGPQLAGKAGQRAREMVAHGAHGIMTGTPDAGSLSAEMLKTGRCSSCGIRCIWMQCSAGSLRKRINLAG